MHSDDDEDWYDDDDELDEEDAAPCPECGEPIHAVTDKCPACGYWLSETDRHRMLAGTAKPLWMRVTAAILLFVLLLSLLMIAVAVL